MVPTSSPSGELCGDILMNLDSELWGKFVIGSAGGIDITAKLEYQPVANNEETAVRVTLKGLFGGHSGLEIHCGRANANKEMVRLVRKAVQQLGARLAVWHGGNMRNAIPFKAEVVLSLAADKVEALKKLVEDQRLLIEDEFKGIEKNVEFFVEPVEKPAELLPSEIQDNLIDAIYACHNGVLRMIPAYPNVVETSSNLAIIDIENGKAAFKILTRSSREDMKEYLCRTLESCFSMAGMKTEFTAPYGGWSRTPTAKSSTYSRLSTRSRTARRLPFRLTTPDWSAPSSSASIRVWTSSAWARRSSLPHTTSERAQVATVEPFWKLLTTALERVPEKK